MARFLKPLVRSGGYYPSRRWTPLVYPGGYTTANGGEEPAPPPIEKTITGNPIHILDALAKPAQALSVKLEPVQDLNGYDNPWPAGGGKNLYPNFSISGSDVGVTIVHNSADESYTVSGISSAYRGFLATSTFILEAGTYTLSRTANNSSATENNLRMEIRSTDGLITYAESVGSGGFTLSADTEVKARIVVGKGGVDFGTGITYRFQIETGSTATAWSPYSNLCPISGWTGANVYHSGADTSDATTYSITFPSEAGTVYGGTLDVTTGKLTVTHGNIASYSGETMPGRWISSMDVYSAGGTPTTGAQVVYELATPQTYQLTPTEVTLLLGENNIWSDGEMTLTYLADGNASDEEALNILLGGRYANNHGEDEPTDREALNIILGENER